MRPGALRSAVGRALTARGAALRSAVGRALTARGAALRSAVGRAVRRRRDAASRVVRRVSRIVTRATAGSLLVRCTVFAAGLVALLPGWPLPTPPALTAVLAGAAAAVPAVQPRGRAPAALMLVASAAWVARSQRDAAVDTWWRLLVVAGAVYLLHTASALAAVLDFDTVVPLRVVARSLARAGAVLAATLGLSVVLLTLVGWLPGGSSTMASVAGLLALVAAVALLLREARNRFGRSGASGGPET